MTETGNFRSTTVVNIITFVCGRIENSVIYSFVELLNIGASKCFIVLKKMKKIAIFGGTGMTGLCTVEAALKQGIEYIYSKLSEVLIESKYCHNMWA